MKTRKKWKFLTHKVVKDNKWLLLVKDPNNNELYYMLNNEKTREWIRGRNDIYESLRGKEYDRENKAHSHFKLRPACVSLNRGSVNSRFEDYDEDGADLIEAMVKLIQNKDEKIARLKTKIGLLQDSIGFLEYQLSESGGVSEAHAQE